MHSTYVLLIVRIICLIVFFFNDTATTEIYTPLHDALPIFVDRRRHRWFVGPLCRARRCRERKSRAARRERAAPSRALDDEDRKSTRLNSSHGYISYAVFCLKKKKNRLLHLPTLEYDHRQ